MKLTHIMLACALVTSAANATDPCSKKGLTYDPIKNMCSLAIDPVSDLTKLKKEDKKKLCADAAKKRKIDDVDGDQMLWLSAKGDTCSRCIPDYKYDPKTNRCIEESKK